MGKFRGTYCPSFIFEKDTNFFGIKKPVGIPLMKWMMKKNRNLWNYYGNQSYRKIGIDFAKVGRWLGVGVYTLHS